MSVNTPSTQIQRNSFRSNTSANTDRTIATLATHQSLFSTVPPPSLRQTNNPGTRRQSLAKSTAASLAKMVPSLSKKVIDRGEHSSINDNTAPAQRTQSFSVSSFPRQLARRSSLKLHDTINPSSSSCTTSNKHGSVLNSTIPTQYRRLSRDLPSLHRRPSKQNKTETLDSPKNRMDSRPDGDEPHKKHIPHRRTSLALSSSNTNLSSSLHHRRSSLVESSSISVQEQYHHPSWLDSAGFMRPSKCAACHPPPPKRTTVITSPVGAVSVPSFAPRRRSRGSLVFEKPDSNPPPQEAASTAKKPEWPDDRTTLESSVEQDSGFASVEPMEPIHEPALSSLSLMSDETVEATTRFTSPAASSTATSLASSVSAKSDLEPWTVQLRLALGRWFSDLNHGQLEHYEKDRSIMTLTGIVVHMDPWLTSSNQPYRLRLAPEDRQQAFQCSNTWTDDDAVDQCQFKTDTTACGCHFDWLNRRHHCRSCGNIFCKEHSLNRLPLFMAEKPNQIKWSRVCDTCCFHLVGSHLVL